MCVFLVCLFVRVCMTVRLVFTAFVGWFAILCVMLQGVLLCGFVCVMAYSSFFVLCLCVFVV